MVWFITNDVGYIALWILSEEVREKPTELDLGLFFISITYPTNPDKYLLGIIAWLLSVQKNLKTHTQIKSMVSEDGT